MKFVPLVCDSSRALGAGRGTLPGSVRGNQSLVDDPPKGGHGLGFSVKKILKKSSGVQRLRIGVRFPLLASFRDPMVRFRGINSLKEARGIEIRAASIVQNAVIISFDSNHDIRQTGGEVRISRVFTTELNNHRDYICQFHPANAWMFIPMILVLISAHPKPWAALLHPGRRVAAVCLDQAANIADAVAFGNDPRLSENPGGQLRNCRHSLSELLTACFYLSVGENTINANAKKAHLWTTESLTPLSKGASIATARGLQDGNVQTKSQSV